VFPVIAPFPTIRSLRPSGLDLIQRWRAEDGTLTVLGLFVFLMMLFAAGISIDLMRSEVERTRLQYTLDRASLAAASLTQTADGRDVVHGYLEAAGLRRQDVQIQFEDLDNLRAVAITTEAETPSLLMRLLGYDVLTQPVAARAEQRQTELEVSLVLDVSGSMRNDGKLNSLKTAAKDFVSKLLAEDTHLTTISIVPYNDRVNLGTMLSAYFPLSSQHSESACVIFDPSDFDRLGLAPGQQLKRMAHIDIDRRDWSEAWSSYVEGRPIREPHCYTDGRSEIIAWSNDEAALHAHIDALEARDSTMIGLGTKWGAILLDPSTRSILEAMTIDGKVDERFAGRPFDYDAPQTEKVLVVMTDGRNTRQWRIRPELRSGPSGVFLHRHHEPIANEARLCDANDATATDCDDPEGGHGTFYRANWSRDAVLADVSPVFFTGTRIATLRKQLQIDAGRLAHEPDTRFQRPADDVSFSFHSRQKGAFYRPEDGAYYMTPAGGTDAFELSYQEVYALFEEHHLFQHVLRNADWPTRKFYGLASEQTHAAEDGKGDAELKKLCRLSVEQGVKVFTIAFKAKADGEAAMRDCAGVGLEANYYDVATDDLSAAFEGILAAILNLKLTEMR
jgi:Flp pilus assembly protein TadG